MLLLYLIAGLAFLLLVLWTVIGYNRLVRFAELVDEAWSGIEVQLGRRASLIPNLVETVRGHARHERSVFEAVARARAALEQAAGVTATAEANGHLTRSLARLLAVVEGYPELRASQSFLDLQDELSDAERKIAFARHFYNRVVGAFNTRVRSIPDVILARAFRFRPREFFEAEAADLEPMSVELA